MSAPAPCPRHRRSWLASCAGCTAWHLPRQLAGRTRTPLARLAATPPPRQRPAA